MNWGKGIIIIMGSFIIFIVVLISILMSNKVDLVSEDYYQKEISFEDDILAETNFDKTGQKFYFNQDTNYLIASLPGFSEKVNFKLILSRPNNNKDDISFDISGDSIYLIPKKHLKKGLYNYRLEFQYNKNSFLKTGKYYLK